jgi:hypothetical protein
MREIIICGGVRLSRQYCTACCEWQLLGLDDSRCPDCGEVLPSSYDFKFRKLGYRIGRKGISAGFKRFLINKQNGRCYWCDRKLGYYYVRKNGPAKKSINHADHIIPYVYLQSNPIDNWCVSCNLCNLFKSSKYFDKESMTRKYILDRWNSETIEVTYIGWQTELYDLGLP